MMRTMNLKIATLVVAILLVVGMTQIKAQRGQMRGNQGQGWVCSNIPDLTDDQEKKIDDLKIEHKKKMLDNRNQMMEKNARLNTLRTAEKADMNAINKLVDEIGVLHTSMMKEKEAHRQAVRNLLTEKQRVFYDSQNRGGQAFCGGRGMGHGMGKGMGRGNQMRPDCPRR